MSDGLRNSDLEVLWLRLINTPAEPGILLTRWSDILIGKKRSEYREHKKGKHGLSKEHWEKLCGPLSFDIETVWKALPQMHAYCVGNSEVVDVEVAQKVRIFLQDLRGKAHTFDNALAVSRNARLQQRLFDESWTYSECDSEWFLSILLKLKRIHGHLQRPRTGTFIECGSGFGGNVFVAALAHSWQRCIGIEAIDSLCKGAEALQQRYTVIAHERLTIHERKERSDLEILFINDDFLELDIILSGSLIYADLTCFNPEQVHAFRKLIDEVPHGTVIVTITQQLVSKHFILLWSEEAQTSVGQAPAYVYERKPPLEIFQKSRTTN